MVASATTRSERDRAEGTEQSSAGTGGAAAQKRYPAPVPERSFRSVLAPVSGRLAHEKIVGRITALRGVSILRAALTKNGAWRRRRLDTPSYEARIVVELQDAEPLRDAAARPYRGVSQSDLDLVVVEIGGYMREIASATVQFTGQSRRRRVCEDLQQTLRNVCVAKGATLSGTLSHRDGESTEAHILQGRVAGPPAAIADIAQLLSDSGVVTPWNLRTRWVDRERSGNPPRA